MSLILLGILNSQAAAAGGAAAYDLLETTVLGSDTASVTFSGLGSYTDYKHLQLRAVARSDRSGAGIIDVLKIQLNGDTGSNYAGHSLRGDGSAVSSSAVTSQSFFRNLYISHSNSTADYFVPHIVDILDFSNASKYTTARSLGGVFDTGDTTQTYFGLNSNLWLNTAAVTSITVGVGFGTNLVANSRLSLYGVR